MANDGARARIIGMAAALSVAAFVLVFVALLALARGPGQWRLASRTSSLPASCCWHPERGQAVRRLRLPSSRAFTLVAFGNNAVDGLILLAATLFEAGAAWALLNQPGPNRTPPPEDR